MAEWADPELRGDWRVERLSGLLPPFGIAKRIGVSSGVTTVFGIPVAPFTASDHDLLYRWLPVRDTLVPDGAGVASLRAYRRPDSPGPPRADPGRVVSSS